MSTTTSASGFETIEPPVAEALNTELTKFLTTVFGGCPGMKEILQGNERPVNDDVFYVCRRNGQVASMCHLTVSRTNPELGGFGEVATAQEHRRTGLAGTVCSAAADEFRRRGGSWLALGTGEPTAARVYYRIGWRMLAGANVMALSTTTDSPEEFLADYFRSNSKTAITPAGAAERVPMIPLIVTPHDWQVLDANAGIQSTRYTMQSSCMSLYPKYQALETNGRGAWFAARTKTGQLVGLSSAQLTDSGTCKVDGFAHKNYEDAWGDLLQATMEWGTAQGAHKWEARLSAEDKEKRRLFETLGFQETGAGEAFTLTRREVASVQLEKQIGG